MKKTYEIEIKMTDGCVINRMVTFIKEESFLNFVQEISMLKSLESLYIDDGNDILIVHTDKIRNIVIKEV